MEGGIAIVPGMQGSSRSSHQRPVLVVLLVLASALSAQYFLGPGPHGIAGWARHWVALLVRVGLWLPFLPVLRGLAARWPFGSPAGTAALLRALCLALVTSVGYALALTALTSLPPLAQVARWQARAGGMFPLPGGFVAALTYELPLALLSGWSLLSIAWALTRHQALAASHQRVRAIQTSLRLARLSVLEAQLHPHFLFNTLNCITTLLDRDADAAASTARRLDDLFRQVADESRPPRLPLRQELQLTACYLDIQRTRFGERLAVQVKVDPDCLDAAVPALLLQPLVENSIRHGLAPRLGPGLLEVRASRVEDRLVIVVADDGPGFARDVRFGTGLRNLARRLRELYDERAFLEIGAGDQPGGARVVVSLPHEIMARPDSLAAEEGAAGSPPPPGGRLRPELMAGLVAVAGMMALSALWATCAHLGYDGARVPPLPLGIRISRAIASGAVSWSLLAVVIFLLVSRLPFRPDRVARLLAIHLLVAALVFSPLKTTVMVLVVKGLWQEAGWPSGQFLFNYWSTRVHEHVFYYLALAGLAYALVHFRSELGQIQVVADLRGQLAERRLASARRRASGFFVRRSLADLPGLIASRSVRAERLISALADLLRHTLHAHRRASVPLSAELTSARLCARVEAQRTGRRCRVRTRCSAALARRQVIPGTIEPLLADLFEQGQSRGAGAWRLRLAGALSMGARDGTGGQVVVELRLEPESAPGEPLVQCMLLPLLPATATAGPPR